MLSSGDEGREKERPEQLVCCIAGDETRELQLEERREVEDLKTVYLFPSPLWLLGSQGVTVDYSSKPETLESLVIKKGTN